MTNNLDNTGIKELGNHFLDAVEKIESFNKNFFSSVSPENGVYGITESVKGNGIVEKTWKNEEGHLNRAYYKDDSLYKLRSKQSDGSWITSFFDDNGTNYLKEVSESIEDKKTKTKIKTTGLELVPNIEVVKGNFSTVIDDFGRPVLSKIKDVVVKEEGRETLSNKLKDAAYKDGDERGHIIADSLGGPSGKENIVPQSFDVNRSQFAQLENLVKDLKNEGHTVDYEIKTNYIGSEKRPSSFEPTITVDGEVYTDIPDNLKKIFNNGESNAVSKVVTNVGEKVGLYHEAGLKGGIEAASLTFAVSTVDNVKEYFQGNLSAEEMVVNITKDTAEAGAIGYATDFISSAVSRAMSESSHTILHSLSKCGVPAAVISFGVESFDSIVDYAQGEIDAKELAYDLGDNAASVAGGAVGAALAGAALGSVVPGAGTAVGFVGGLVGGMVGTAIASEVYQTAVELGTENADIILDKVKTTANETIDMAKNAIPDKVDSIKNALNNFTKSNNIPISF